MKLIIQIPCFNEADSLPITLAALPTNVQGFDSVEWLVIDDGSSDDTSSIAKQHGVHHVVRHLGNKGLATAFVTGIEMSLHLGADVIVNTDADNQYNAEDIPVLTQPILEHRAEIVIGARPIDSINHFTFTKKLLQHFGSWVVRRASRTEIADATSGFRAFSRLAAESLIIYGNYTYTLESIIQAGQKNMAIISVPIRVNGELRKSRLIRNIPSYVKRSAVTLIRIFILYRPFRFFSAIAMIQLLIGSLIGFRFIWFYSQGNGNGHLQSLILSAALLIVGFQTLLTAFVADLLAANRKLSEDIRLKISILSQKFEK
jgi:glycosyltransferase involved in cell wall biosynthesis